MDKTAHRSAHGPPKSSSAASRASRIPLYSLLISPSNAPCYLQATPGKPTQSYGPRATDTSNGSSPGGGSPAAPTTGDASDNLLIEAKRLRALRHTFRETDVLSERGVWRLYDQFQRLPLSGVPGHEASDMGRIASLYTDWARQLAPNVHPLDVLTKCRYDIVY